MPLQDLTPQLRTRLSRMEKMVGWFVMLAVTILLVGFAYYLYHTAERKGWFRIKARYFTFIAGASGLKVGDPVRLMGFDAGVITDIMPMPADEYDFNVYLEFELLSPNYGYMWTEGSRAKLAQDNFLGKRAIEVTRGTGGYPTYVSFPLRRVSLAEAQALPDLEKWALAQEVFVANGTNLLAKPRWPLTNLPALGAAGYSNILIMDEGHEQQALTGIWNKHQSRYEPLTAKKQAYELPMDESPSVSDQIQALVGQVEHALPGFFNLTNPITSVLSNAVILTSNLNLAVLDARPAAAHLASLTAQLEHPGALGEWLLPTNLEHQMEATLGHVDTTVIDMNTNLATLAAKLGQSLDHVAGLTSNLNSQVQANSNLLSEVSQIIVHADEFVEGLKRHWLLRSAFREKSTNAVPAAKPHPVRSPGGKIPAASWAR